MKHTVESLRAFEQDIAEEFNFAKIKAPIHLSGGNEAQLMRLFEVIRPTDWVFSTWRSHFHALLHGVDPSRVKADIMAGKSIALCFPDHRFYSSAIVGGILPIALGTAWSIKRNGGAERVWAFIGDMAAMTGIAHEVRTYASGFGLPLSIVTEDNGKSVCTDTRKVWATAPHDRAKPLHAAYSYELPWPHSGAGRRVEF